MQWRRKEHRSFRVWEKTYKEQQSKKLVALQSLKERRD